MIAGFPGIKYGHFDDGIGSFGVGAVKTPNFGLPIPVFVGNENIF